MNDYKIDRHKFFDRHERQSILINTEKRCLEDRAEGRKTWIIRWMLVDLAFYSGLRVSEIAALTLDQIKLDNRQPYIRVLNGKGDKNRDVYIRDQLTQHLKDFIKSKDLRNEAAGPDAYLFPGRDGQISTTALTMSFKKAVKDTPKLRHNLSIHSARHTYATFLYADCKNLKFVQRQLGHTDIQMTQLYVGILPEENGKLANSMT